MQDLKLTMTLDEANLILAALAELPFAKVFSLVAKIQDQAGRQLDRAGTSEPLAHEGNGKSEVEPLLDTAGKSPHAA